MNVRILPSSPDPSIQYLTSFLIRDTVAVDVGCLGFQREPGHDPVENVFLTHSHLDHVASLPILLENRGQPVSIYGHPATLASLKSDFFNDRIWPDLFRRDPDIEDRVRLVPLENEAPVELGDLRVTPVEVTHTVPTFGFLFEDEDSAVAFGSDSGPTDRLWDVAGDRPQLKAAFVEASFPDRLAGVAGKTGHLTPRLLEAEAAKLPSGTTVIAVHIKPRYRNEVVEELRGLGVPRLEVGVTGKNYVF